MFQNYGTYLQALNQKGDGTVVLRTHYGLNLTVRQNIWDVNIIREILFDKPYTRHLSLPSNPLVVDIGGYIGDFSLYAVKYLNARQVIVYEPTAENFVLLTQNVQSNGYADRITAVNAAVGSSDEMTLNVQVQENNEIHASAHWYKDAEKRATRSVTLPDVFEIHRIDSIDLLKVDCEGAEYQVFSATPDDVFTRIRNIAFEFHHVDGFETKLPSLLNRLESLGYTLRRDAEIISAYRAD